MCVYETDQTDREKARYRLCVLYMCIDRPSSSLCDYSSSSPQTACDLSEWARFSEGWQFRGNCNGISLNPHSTITLSSPSHSLSLSSTHTYTYILTHLCKHRCGTPTSNPDYWFSELLRWALKPFYLSYNPKLIKDDRYSWWCVFGDAERCKQLRCETTGLKGRLLVSSTPAEIIK